MEHYLQVEMNNASARSEGAHTQLAFSTIIHSRVVNNSNQNANQKPPACVPGAMHTSTPREHKNGGLSKSVLLCKF